jgi:hypothetical protein
MLKVRRTALKPVKSRIVVISSMARTGTTFLFHTLQEHPFAYIPFREVDGSLYKETGYFTVNYGRGTDWYLSMFDGMRPDQVGFDISTLYITDRGSIERIRSFARDIKIIMCLRDPAECALSSYANFSFWTGDAAPFEEFIESFSNPTGDGVVYHASAWKDVIDIVEEYRRVFGDDLLLYSFDLFRTDPLYVVQCIESFAGLPSYFNEDNFNNIPINASRRGRNKILTHLITFDPLVRILKVLIPHRLQVSMHGSFLKWCARKEGPARPSYDPKQARIAQERLSKQREYVRNLFESEAMRLGSGRPFTHRKAQTM